MRGQNAFSSITIINIYIYIYIYINKNFHFDLSNLYLYFICAYILKLKKIEMKANYVNS